MKNYRAAPSLEKFEEAGFNLATDPTTLRLMWKAQTYEELYEAAPEGCITGNMDRINIASLRRLAVAKAAGFEHIDCEGQLLVNWRQQKFPKFEPPLVYTCRSEGEYVLAFIGRRMTILKKSELPNKVYRSKNRTM